MKVPKTSFSHQMAFILFAAKTNDAEGVQKAARAETNSAQVRCSSASANPQPCMKRMRATLKPSTLSLLLGSTLFFTYPTVVKVTNDHQTPSIAPGQNVGGNCLRFHAESYNINH